ncbi:MAG: geranylgeranyl reductase family protein [Acidimicrobiia bacterium]|nr:geranylgeranyl reductase family protein [Acidimicrobiia bacterium]
MRHDVVVVGGGPAGAAAAAHCAAAGLDVLVVDKAGFPRDKTCGDGLTAGALRELEGLGIDVPKIAQQVRRTEVIGPYGTRVTFDATLASGAWLIGVVARFELDERVLGRAVDLGASHADGLTFSGLSQGRDGVDVVLDGAGATTTVAARYVIGADGAQSRVRTAAFGPSETRMPGMQALRQYFDTPESDLLTVTFRADLLPGYGWIFPLPGGGVNIGVGVQRDPAHHGVETLAALTNDKGRVGLRGLAELYRRFLAAPEVRERIGSRPEAASRIQAWPIPSDPDLAELVAGRVLLAGDAARVVDPMTGEGIGQALLTGRLAAEAIAAGGSADEVGRRYRRLVARDLGADLRFARWMMVHALRHRRGIEWGLRLASANDWTRRNFMRWLYEDYPRAFVGTPRRWRRHSMRGVGAFSPVRTGSPRR